MMMIRPPGDLYAAIEIAGRLLHGSDFIARFADEIGCEPTEAEATEIYIGPLHEFTRDVNDPRLERTPAERRRGYRAQYTTVCQRLVNEARERGLLIDC